MTGTSFCVEELGEKDVVLHLGLAHGDTAWPESVEQTLDRARLSKNAKRKILGENALRLCPRLRS